MSSTRLICDAGTIADFCNRLRYGNLKGARALWQAEGSSEILEAWFGSKPVFSIVNRKKCTITLKELADNFALARGYGAHEIAQFIWKNSASLQQTFKDKDESIDPNFLNYFDPKLVEEMAPQSDKNPSKKRKMSTVSMDQNIENMQQPSKKEAVKCEDEKPVQDNVFALTHGEIVLPTKETLFSDDDSSESKDEALNLHVAGFQDSFESDRYPFLEDEPFIELLVSPDSLEGENLCQKTVIANRKKKRMIRIYLAR